MAAVAVPLGQILRERGLLSEDQLQLALAEQRRSGARLGRVLAELGFVSEGLVRESLGASLGRECIDLRLAVPDAGALAKLPVAIARRYRALPVAWDARRQRLQVAVADPCDIIAQDQLRRILGPDVGLTLLLASETDLAQCIERFYGFDQSLAGIIAELESSTPEDTAVAVSPADPAVRLVDALLSEAVRDRASDIHFEPERGFVRIRYRVDGLMQHVRCLHVDWWPGMVVRLKILAGMDIAESRAPQDGQFTAILEGRQVEFRASAQPVLRGENIVLRVLDRARAILSLAELDITAYSRRRIEALIQRPEGMILVTGPTGSGKTTTLYSILNSINDETRNIMTLEDPVEYPLPLVRQAQMNGAVKMDFANGIRTMLRQDPDVILVGEIRDEATAQMALRAAMTGHRVFSTVHCGNAAGVVARLLELGVSAGILAGNIAGVLAQRLLRRLCPHCRLEADTETLLEVCPTLRVATDLPPRVYEPRGCPRCRHQGYAGRVLIMETLPFDEEIEELVLTGGGRRELEQHAIRHGFVSLAGDAVTRVLRGETSVMELLRVVDPRRGLGAWHADLLL